MPSANAINVLENAFLRAEFDSACGNLIAIVNRLTNERWTVTGDAFAVESDAFRVDLANARFEGCEASDGRLRCRYVADRATVTIDYTLGPGNAFLEKRIALVPAADGVLNAVEIGKLDFAGPQLLAVVPYRYQQCIVFFGRTPLGGFFTGLEMAFDVSTVEANRVTLRGRANLRIRGGDRFDFEPAFLGVYRRAPGERDLPGELVGGYQYQHLPLQSESDAMVALVSAVLGPPRHGPLFVLSPSCCGGENIFRREAEWPRTPEAAERNRRIVDFAAECGIGWMQDAFPWGGEIAKLNALAGDAVFQPDTRVTSLLDYARSRGVTPMMWSTFTNTQPWSEEGRPFRLDRPEWRITPLRAEAMPDGSGCMELVWNPLATRGNCLGDDRFVDWLIGHFLHTMETGGYRGFSIDGDYFGTGAWFTTTGLPAQCLAQDHGHAPGESQYACQRGLTRFLAAVRERFPDAFLWLMRPMMDFGVWTCRGGDAVFPIDECGRIANMTHIADQTPNVTYGDKIRFWSRIRCHRQFYPHYLDQVQLFATFDGSGDGGPWLSAKLDYVMLSALASTPHICCFTGPVDAIPSADRGVIRRWLDWARENASFLMVRKDLPEWPAKGKVDGTAHMYGDRGFVILFNPNREPMTGTFDLTEAGIGLQRNGDVTITEIHPAPGPDVRRRCGETVSWNVPGESAVVLRLSPVM